MSIMICVLPTWVYRFGTNINMRHTHNKHVLFVVSSFTLIFSILPLHTYWLSSIASQSLAFISHRNTYLSSFSPLTAQHPLLHYYIFHCSYIITIHIITVHIITVHIVTAHIITVHIIIHSDGQDRAHGRYDSSLRS